MHLVAANSALASWFETPTFGRLLTMRVGVTFSAWLRRN